MRITEFDDDLIPLPPTEPDEGCEGEREIAGVGDPLFPDCGMDGEEVERLDIPYSTRAPGDWVSSGPLGLTWTEEQLARQRSRHFETWEAAEVWARRFHKHRFRGRVLEAQIDGATRWAFLVARADDGEHS